MIPLRAGQPKQALFKDGIVAIPKSERKTQVLFSVADAPQPVLISTVSPTAGMIVREVFPKISPSAVVLAHGAPGAFAEIRPPQVPIPLATLVLVQPLVFPG
jgi:hypothetical protein